MKFPLTDFIIQMLKTDPAALRRADPGKLARKYNIESEHAAGHLALHCGVEMAPVEHHTRIGELG
jgi:hypothetical protein